MPASVALEDQKKKKTLSGARQFQAFSFQQREKKGNPNKEAT